MKSSRFTYIQNSLDRKNLYMKVFTKIQKLKFYSTNAGALKPLALRIAKRSELNVC
jgi:hypothetical protein